MENLFNLFSANLKSRYLTLLKNLKYKSNSFYDAYNSLVEEYLREISFKELGINKIKGSIHDILNVEEVKNYFINVLMITKTSYNKLLDYASKINQHKHRLEHKLTLENAINYFKLMYDFVYAYTSFKGLSIPNYDEEFIRRTYGSGVIQNNIDNRLSSMENKIDFLYTNSDAYLIKEKKSKEEQEKLIERKIDDLKANGSMLFVYSEPSKDIKKYKIKLAILFGIILFSLISVFVLSIIFFKKNSYIPLIIDSLFIFYYTKMSINFFKIKDSITIEKIRSFHIISMTKLNNGKYIPIKVKTIFSFCMCMFLIIFEFLAISFIFVVSNINSETLYYFVSFVIIAAFFSFVYRTQAFAFLEKYDNIFLYDDEAEVTYFTFLNRFMDFKFKK